MSDERTRSCAHRHEDPKRDPNARIMIHQPIGVRGLAVDVQMSTSDPGEPDLLPAPPG
jgi:hypothetical protein